MPFVVVMSDQAVTVGTDGVVYVADSLNCQLRRIASAVQTANALTCATRLVDVIRPLGCTMYNAPIDLLGFQVGGTSACLSRGAGGAWVR